MAQLDDLQTTLAAISTDTDEIVADFKTLQDALAAAQATSGANLQPALDAANAIRAKLDALAASANPAPAPAPASEPTPGA